MKYFTIKEFEQSGTARMFGIDNRVPVDLQPNIEALVDKVLDPLREAYGKPIVVMSGYRCDKLNRAVGGAVNSHHKKALAADIVGRPATVSENKRIFQLVLELGLPFTQLIDEQNYSWIHISYDPNDLRREVLHL